jgi:hypothetical protein
MKKYIERNRKNWDLGFFWDRPDFCHGKRRKEELACEFRFCRGGA